MTLRKNSRKHLLVGTDAKTLTLECRQLRKYDRDDLPSANEVIAFLDGYNSFINHAARPFSPMLEVKMLL
jgi:hypothetical protein